MGKERYSEETTKKYEKIVIDYIRKNNHVTHREIKKKFKIRIYRLFRGGLKEAYFTAGVPLPKRLKRRTRKQQIDDVLDYIRKNPGCRVTEIQNVVRVAIPRLFGSIITAYDMAGVEYKKSEYATGTSTPEIRNRAERFENYVLKFLSNIGRVKKKVKVGKREFLKMKIL